MSFTPYIEPMGASPSLLCNNLTASGRFAAFATKNRLRLVNTTADATRSHEGPVCGDAITSLKYLPPMGHGGTPGSPDWILCVGSTVGTHIYSEDAALLLHLVPLEKNEDDRLACHRGACAVLCPAPNTRFLLFGDYLGRILLVQHAASGFSTSASKIAAPSSCTCGVVCLESTEVAGEVVAGYEDGTIVFWALDMSSGSVDNVSATASAFLYFTPFYHGKCLTT